MALAASIIDQILDGLVDIQYVLQETETAVAEPAGQPVPPVVLETLTSMEKVKKGQQDVSVSCVTTHRERL